MKVEHITPILNVADVGVSLDWFERLGWQRCWTYNDSGPIDGAADENDAGHANFAAVACGECEIFLCKDGQGARGGSPPHRSDGGSDETTGVWMSWWLKTPAEVNELHALAVSQGMTVPWPPTDEPWGVREFHLRHPDGHTFRIGAALIDE